MKSQITFCLFFVIGMLICSTTAIAQFSIEPEQHEFAPTQINTTSTPFEFTITNISDSVVTVHPEHLSISPVEDRSKELSVLSYNIEFDKRDWIGRLNYMLEGFRSKEIDILGLQEVIQREHLDNQAMTIADSLGFYYYFDSVDEEGRDQRYGNAIVSRYPIIDTNFRALEPTSAFRKVVHTKLDVDGNIVDVYNTHLHNPPDAGPIRTEQIADLLDFVEQTNSGGVMFLTGDFNSAPDWPEMKGLYEVFTDVYPLFHDNHLDPEHSTLNPRLGFPERRIDYVFFNDEGSGEILPLSAELILDDVQEDDQLENDHFGVLARFNISWDTSEFDINGPDSTVGLGPGESINIAVVFKPTVVGNKEAELRLGDSSASILGEAFDATITQFPYTEDFSDVPEFELPFGWSANADNWYVFNSETAGGSEPELVFWWEPQQEGRFYVQTPPMQTSGFDSLNVTFRHHVQNFEQAGIYNLELVTIADGQEFVVLQWNDPEDIPNEEISAKLYRDEHGVGADALQLAFVYDGPSGEIVRWAIDDLEVGAEPQLVIDPQEIDFGLQNMERVSDSVMVTITNIGGGVIDLSPDDIQISGEHTDDFILGNIGQSISLGGQDTARVSVRFDPQEAGTRTAYLEILGEQVPLTGQVFDQTSHIERYIDLNMMRGGGDDDSEFTRVPNPDPDDVNSSDEVVKFHRSQHGVPWGGFFAFMPEPLDLTENQYVYVDVWKPRISPVRFKVEDGASADLEIESMNPQTVTDAWETLVFDFSEKTGEWNVIAFMPDFNNPVDLDEDITIYFANIRIGSEPSLVSTEDEGAVPREFGLDQNYPNPFNPTTTIGYRIPEASHVKLTVYDVMGREVARIVDQELKAGYHRHIFDASHLASGVYIYRIQAGEFSDTQKLMLVK